MTSSSRRKHRTTAPITRAATRPKADDLSRAILIMVAIFAAVLGTLAHAAFGQDERPSSRRPSSRRVQPSTTQAEFRPKGAASAPTSKTVETFVVKSSTIHSTQGKGQPGHPSDAFETRTKRFVASAKVEEQTSINGTSGELKWRTPARRHFQAASTGGTGVAQVAYEEEVAPADPPPANQGLKNATDQYLRTRSVVRQAQASRFTDPAEPTDIPPTETPLPTQPEAPGNDPDIPPLTLDPPSALDDLLPPLGPDVDPLPGRDPPPPIPRKEEGDSCNLAWKAVEESHLRRFHLNILDITPHFAPSLEPTIPMDEAEEKAERIERRNALMKLAPRPWHNNHGEQVAFGRFIDYQWGRILILTEDGAEVPVPLYDLGRDEFNYVRAHWRTGEIGLPEFCRIQDRELKPGDQIVHDFTLTTFHWKASALCHKPLYFEEVQLERYGHSHGPLLQPIVSTGHFFVNIAIVPYKMGINPPNECMYALGYYRPGNCAPYMIPPVPYSIRGGLYQAAAVVGGVALFP